MPGDIRTPRAGLSWNVWCLNVLKAHRPWQIMDPSPFPRHSSVNNSDLSVIMCNKVSYSNKRNPRTERNFSNICIYSFTVGKADPWRWPVPSSMLLGGFTQLGPVTISLFSNLWKRQLSTEKLVWEDVGLYSTGHLLIYICCFLHFYCCTCDIKYNGPLPYLAI